MNLTEERLGHVLKLVRGDMSFPADRSLLPVVTPMYTPFSMEDFAKRPSADVTYAEVDAVIEAGYVGVHKHDPTKWITRLYLTAEGNRLVLDLGGFNWDRWKTRHGKRICCEEARPATCVCEVRVMCPVHGNKCHGTHD